MEPRVFSTNLCLLWTRLQEVPLLLSQLYLTQKKTTRTEGEKHVAPSISHGHFLYDLFTVSLSRLSKRGTTCNLKRVLLLNLIFLLLAVSQTLCTGVSGEERYFPVFSSTEVRWRKAGYKHDELLVNPLTPVPPVNGCDEHWPLFHF